MRKNYEKKTCEAPNMINGNSVDIVVNKCDSEIKADIIVSEFNSIRIWGQVKNCNGQPVAHVLVKLLKVIKTCNGFKYEGVSHTISDCSGFYQFDICDNLSCNHYKILVGKSVCDPKKIVIDSNCDLCNNKCNKCTENNCRRIRENYPNCYNECCYYDDIDCYDCSDTEEYIPYE